MWNFFGSLYSYYPIVLVLQGFCVWHCIRRGTQNKWVWIIVFLPLVGSLAYIFTEVIQKRHTSSLGDTIGSVVNPGGRIKKLEQNFKFSDTYANRVALADAYLDAKMYDKAIELYESVISGIFDNSEETLKKLIEAYYKTGRIEDVVRVAARLTNTLNFTKSTANFYYARALEQTGHPNEAEAEYKKMNHRFINYQQRYYYAMFLVNQNRSAEAMPVLETIHNEAEHLSNREKGVSSEWINRAQQEYKKLMSSVQSG
jgi:hypothetical protein